MKRIFAILLLVVFAIANSGAAITFHYCKGHLSKVELGSEAHKCCCKTKMAHHCCTSKTVIVKLKTHFIQDNPAPNNPVQPEWVSAVFMHNLSLCNHSENIRMFSKLDILPPLIKNHILLNKVFRI